MALNLFAASFMLFSFALLAKVTERLVLGMTPRVPLERLRPLRGDAKVGALARSSYVGHPERSIAVHRTPTGAHMPTQSPQRTREPPTAAYIGSP